MAPVTPKEERTVKVTRKAPEKERVHFRELVLANPNYFGNLKGTAFEQVTLIVSNVNYEEVECIGFNPPLQRLEAVVLVKQDFGYGGGICSQGTPEYVRFYADWTNTGTWTDLGIVSFNARDIPGNKPLEFNVTLQIQPKKDLCITANLPKIRAILSWNALPPPNTPDFQPVWGNVIDAHIQIDPLKFIPLKGILEASKASLSQGLEPLVNPDQGLSLKTAEVLNASKLSSLYKNTNVPAHRYLFAEVNSLASTPSLTPSLMATASKGVLQDLELNLTSVIGTILLTSGNTNYEELDCVGLDPNLDVVTGILKVKLPAGYSGNLCTAGSQEYVAFWIDWGDGSGFSYVGTSSVNVHDVATIPPEGLEYAVVLPVDIISHRQPCSQGAKTVQIRAILSWQVPPPPANPDYVPTWGNHVDTVALVKPGPTTLPESHTPFIETVGSMAVTSIDSITGLANGPAVAVGFSALDSPFGGTVTITGHIAHPPDIVGGGATPLQYRVLVSSDGGITWQVLTNSFTIWLSQLQGGTWTGPNPTTQSTVDGWYTYYEDLTNGPGNPQQFVAENVLAQWLTGPGITGKWLVKIEAKDPTSNTVYPGTQTITVALDNAPPTTKAMITSAGGQCADFTIGDPVAGTYSVFDEHFGRLNLSVQPDLGGIFTSPTPLPRTYPTVPTWGESGNWSLNTALMPRCGYVVYLEAWDRTIVNSGYIGWYSFAVVGLCLRA